MGIAISSRRSQTRERLILAAAEAFAAKGVVGSTVEEICDIAGFTRGAFYSNFNTKDDLCLAMLEWWGDRSYSAAQAAVAGLSALSGHDLDRSIDQAIWVFLRSQPQSLSWVLTNMELRLYAAREAQLRRPYLEFLDRSQASFIELIEQATALFGLELTMPTRMAVDTLHGVYQHGAVQAVITGSDHDQESLHAQLTSVLRSMLRPRGWE